MTQHDVLKELRTIPGIGVSLSQDLYDLGIRSVSSLKNKDPEKLYAELCELQHTKLDRCVLYTFRCAVYYASHTKHDPEKLKWWNWMDKKPKNKHFRLVQTGRV